MYFVDIDTIPLRKVESRLVYEFCKLCFSKELDPKRNPVKTKEDLEIKGEGLTKFYLLSVAMLNW
jgi:hypothetical protein